MKGEKNLLKSDNLRRVPISRIEVDWLTRILKALDEREKFLRLTDEKRI